MSIRRNTIVAVAREAGVAVSTVSRVLNGGSASAEVRERVLRAVELLDYQPSAAARNLKLSRTGIVGLVTGTSQAPWFIQLLGAMEEVLRTEKASVAIASTRRDGVYDFTAVETWIDQRLVDGIVWARAGEAARPVVERAAARGIPLSLVAPDADYSVGVHFRSDNQRAGEVAAAHLWELGHRKVAVYPGPRDSRDAHSRLAGVVNHWGSHGLSLDPEWIRFAETFETHWGQIAADHFLSLPAERRPTAAVLGNDAMALAFLRRVISAGIRVPQELSVIGFDGVPEGALTWPGLTTVGQLTQQMGHDACTVLFHPSDRDDEEIEHPAPYGVELIVRESTSAVG